MTPCPWLLALVLASVQETSPFDTGLVRSIEIAPPPGTYVQHFRLDREAARAGEPPQALLRYVAGPDTEGGVRAELEIEYSEGGLHVIHTEQAGAARRRLVFREVRERGGRTLFLEGSPERGYSGYEFGGPEVLRRSFPADCGAGELPLLLFECVRLDLPSAREMAVFDPLAARFEDLDLESRASADAEASGERTLEARRADGSLRWRVSLCGREIRAWRFQERGPLARAIPPEEFARLREQRELAAHAAREAAANAARRPFARR